jgi:hypothetical protein
MQNKIKTMKKVLLSLLLLVAFGSTQAQDNVDSVLAKYEAAIGGREKLNSIATLQYTSTLHLNMMGQTMDLPLNAIIEKNKLFRRQIPGMMGGEDSYTLITDTTGYTYTPAIPSMGDFPGRDAALTKMDAEKLTKQQYQTDCAGMFGALVNYAAKGNKAELDAKGGKVGKVDCYKVKITLKNGVAFTYYISKTDYLVLQAEAVGEAGMEMLGFGGMMGMFGGGEMAERLKKITTVVKYSEYKEFGGVKFPTKMIFALGPQEMEAENSDFKVNESIDKKWYKTD